MEENPAEKSPPQPAPQAEKSFGYFYCILVDAVFCFYFAWLTWEMTWPVIKLISQNGLPRQPHGWYALADLVWLILLAGFPFTVFSFALYQLVRRHPVARGPQTFLSLFMMILGFPLGTVFFLPSFYFVFLERKTHEVLGAMEMYRRPAVFSLVFALLYAVFISWTANGWVFDFAGGAEKFFGTPYLRWEDKLLRWKADLHRSQSSKQEDVPLSSPAVSSQPEHSIVLKNGNQVVGKGLVRSEDGFTLNIENYGNIYFSKDEILSIDGHDPATLPPDFFEES